MFTGRTSSITIHTEHGIMQVQKDETKLQGEAQSPWLFLCTVARD